MSDCGSCQHFWKSKKLGAGICELHDMKVSTDSGHDCTDHKRIPYKRNHEKDT